jgi:hypothetical protein
MCHHDGCAPVWRDQMNALLGFFGEHVHERQRSRHEPPDRRVLTAEHEQLHGKHIAVALDRAAHIIARHESLQHAIDLARAASDRLDDLGPRQAVRLAGEEFQYVEALIESRGPIPVFRGLASAHKPSPLSERHRERCCLLGRQFLLRGQFIYE